MDWRRRFWGSAARLTLWFAAAMCAVSIIAPAAGVAQAAEAEPELLTRFCEGRFTDVPPFLRPTAAGECNDPTGVAVDQSSGDIYVGEPAIARVSRYTAWGSFVGSWGWGVRDGADELETCTGATGCQAGTAGAGPGQIGDYLLTVAVDSSGDVYIGEWKNHRIQEFTPQGEFVLMFGGGVDQGGGTPSNPGNICTAEFLANGDTCGAGSAGSGPGEFRAEEGGDGITLAIDSRGTASDSDDVIYVGDGSHRIQKFNTEGDRLGELALPVSGNAGALAVDSSPASPNFGDLYVSERNSESLLPIKPNAYRVDPNSGSLIATLQSPRPVAITVEQGGIADILNAKTELTNTQLVRVQPDGTQSGVFLEQEFEGSARRTPMASLVGTSDLAASSACGLSEADLLIPSWSAPTLEEVVFSVGIYGPPPNPAVCPPPVVAPTITEQYATAVNDSEATVQARVNPHFWPDTKVYVEYGTSPCKDGGCTATAGFPGQEIGGKVTNSPVTGPQGGLVLGEGGTLSPDTTYFYRFVAQSSGGGPVFGVAPSGGAASEAEGLEGTFHTFAVPPPPKADCPNQALRSGPSAHLPDCRAYELVSPAENGGGIGPPAEAHDLSSPDGNAVTFATLVAGFGDPASTPFAPQYMSSRNPSIGWQTQPIDPPRALPSLRAAQNVNFLYRGFSPDLCEGWLEQDTEVPLAVGAPPGVPNLYRRSDLHEGCPSPAAYELLTTVAPPGFGVGLEPTEPRYFLEIQGMSADGRTTLVRANAKLTEDANSADLFQLYAANGGALHLVSVLPNGNPAPTHASAGTTQSTKGGTFKEASVVNAISEDGERVFWTACTIGAEQCEGETRQGGSGGCQGSPNGCQLGTLYVRIHPLRPQSKVAAGACTQPTRACTYLVSAAGLPTRFLGATPSGSAVLYLTGEDLFERDVTEVIGGGPGAAPVHIAGGVSGIMGFSRDLGRIYLESTEVCGSNAGAAGSYAVAGKPNLYLYEPGESCGAGELQYIATLGSAEARPGANTPEVIGNSPIHLLPWARTSRVTPDGRVAIFTSSQPLTGIASADVASGRMDAQVFRFDADQGSNGELICLSCSPTRAAPTGQNVAGTDESWVAGTIPGWIDQFHAGNALSESGNRVFFESFSRLTPGDRNDQRDVYEWEAAGGEAQCLGEIGGEVFIPGEGGCLSLISGGEGNQPSLFLDASTDGRDAFIVTSSSLVPQDPGFRDVYDARELGGFPAPGQAPPGCEISDQCRHAGQAPTLAIPGSQTAGPGNPPAKPPRPCRKKESKGKKGKRPAANCRPPRPPKHHKHHHRHRSAAVGKGRHKASGEGAAK